MVTLLSQVQVASYVVSCFPFLQKIMRLWSRQHPTVLQTLQRGECYVCTWDCVPNKQWHSALPYLKPAWLLGKLSTLSACWKCGACILKKGNNATH